MKAFLLWCAVAFFATELRAHALHVQDQSEALTAALASYFQVPPGKNSVLVVIYMAARNDLSIFAERHIKQLQNLGSTNNVKMFVHLDMQKTTTSVTKNFFIDKNRLLKVGSDTLCDSGKKETLIDSVRLAYDYFPAENVILILWNHGTGPIEPTSQPSVHPWEVWRVNANEKFDLDDSIGYLDRITQGETSFENPKGICFDDASGSYLTIKDLTDAIGTISHTILKKRITILACDACLMAGADVFLDLQPYVQYFVASQEVELGLGYKYDLLMEPLLKGTLGCTSACASHFVASYKEFYSPKIDYYTHVAIQLDAAIPLEKNIDELAQWLEYGLATQKDKSVKEAIRLSRHKNNCTRFNEPTYLDLGHLYKNLQRNLSAVELQSPAETQEFKRAVDALLQEGLFLIKKSVLANAVGEKHRNASGISIYFPEFIVHKSYYKNAFATRTHWLTFLKKYVAKN